MNNDSLQHGPFSREIERLAGRPSSPSSNTLLVSRALLSGSHTHISRLAGTRRSLLPGAARLGARRSCHRRRCWLVNIQSASAVVTLRAPAQAHPRVTGNRPCSQEGQVHTVQVHRLTEDSIDERIRDIPNDQTSTLRRVREGQRYCATGPRRRRHFRSRTRPDRGSSRARALENQRATVEDKYAAE